MWSPLAGTVGGPPLRAYKSADETVTSSITLQDDDHLFIAIGANEVWSFTVDLYYDAIATADLLAGIDCSVATSVIYSGTGPGSTQSAAPATMEVRAASVAGGSVTGFTFGGFGAGTLVGGRHMATVFNGASAGTVRFRWAQASSQSTGTIVKKGSVMLGYRLL